MTICTRPTTQELAVIDHGVFCAAEQWLALLKELAARGGGRRESGAFLLGQRVNGCRQIRDFVPYDELDPRCLDTGIIDFDGNGYDRLWKICRDRGMEALADVHTHPARAFLSSVDGQNPMIREKGHVALIIPNYALKPVPMRSVGVYEYQGDYAWTDWSGQRSTHFLHIGKVE